MKNLFYVLLFCTSFSLLANSSSHKAPCDRAFLGIHSTEISMKKAEILGFQNPHGVYVTKIVNNSAADKAGLQPFDYIYAIGMFEMTDSEGLTRIMNKFEPGDEAEILFVRKGKQQSVTVQFDKSGSISCVSPAIRKSFLGVQKVNDGFDEGGIEVRVMNNTSAEKIGLQNGDVITEIDGVKMVDWKDLTTMMGTKQAGEPIAITYFRDGEFEKTSGDLETQRGYSYSNSDCEDKWDERADRWEERAERFEERAERFEEKAEKWAERIEEEAEELEEKIEERIERYLERERDDDDSGFNEEENFHLNEGPQMPSPIEENNEVRIADLAPNIDMASNEEIDFLASRKEAVIAPEVNLIIENITFSADAHTGHHNLDFSIPTAGGTIVQLFNASGRLIYEYELGSFSGQFHDQIDVSQNAPGEYFLIVNQNDNMAVRKVKFELQ